jgi:hypothetical protein
LAKHKGPWEQTSLTSEQIHTILETPSNNLIYFGDKCAGHEGRGERGGRRRRGWAGRRNIYIETERERERERETETEILHFNVVRHIISVESFLILYKLKNNFDNIYI